MKNLGVVVVVFILLLLLKTKNVEINFGDLQFGGITINSLK